MRTEPTGMILLLSFVFLASAAQDAKNCSAPPEYPNTSLLKKFSSRKVFSSGDKVYYSCSQNFTSVLGSRSVECKDGKWSQLTLKCQKMLCGNAGELPNGEFQYKGETYIGEKVYAKCNKGYTLKGPNFMTCEMSGWTGEFPSCEKEATTCSSPVVANSEQTGGVSEHRVGDSMTVFCEQGFQPDGAQKITCEAGGLWRPEPPRCLPSPEAGCGTPPPVSSSNANLANKYITRKSFSSGEKVYYGCNVGYNAKEGSRTRVCNKGKWTPLTLQCERKDCGNAGEIPNGEFEYTGSQFGDRATAVCNEGFKLVGRATRNCLADGWDGRNPVCEAVHCQEPKETNAARKSIQDQPYTYRSVITYYCRGETLVGPKEIWCTKNGTWSASPPECKVITCPAPNIPYGLWVNAQKQSYRPGDTIDPISCKTGFILRGPKYITCSMGGRWVPRPPQCQRRPLPFRRG